MARRPRILFVAEAATLAHVTRPLVLARSLDRPGYDIHFACAEGYGFCLEGQGFTRWTIDSAPSEAFLRALALGTPLYDSKKLAAYVPDDLRLLDEVRPDLVVGDFRLSLSVSAAHRGVRYASITNAHWSPYSTVRRFPLPEHPLVRVFGVTLAEMGFQWLQPAIFAHHARPTNAMRRKYGLLPLGSLGHVYTHGDFTLYADVPSLGPTTGLPVNHRYLGPVLWSPDVPRPPWWDEVGKTRACVYVTLGSSGQVAVLPRVLDALAMLPVDVLVATAGRTALPSLPSNAWVADYLPGIEAAKRSSFIVANGGSPTVYQALAAGVPVLGIASNMDQYLMMASVVRAGAGLLLRAGRATSGNVFHAASRLIDEPSFRTAAKAISNEIAQYDAGSRFAQFVDALFPGSRDPGDANAATTDASSRTG